MLQESQIILNPLRNLKEKFESPLQQVDRLILESVSGDEPLIKTIATTLISAGGKRLRPTLCLASSQLTGNVNQNSYYLAASVELIHAATLLHDDVVDESHLRRGKQTANIVWGNKPSILVGDFLFAKAFELMVKTSNVKFLEILASASSKISEGEVTQLRCIKSLDLTIEDYLKIIEYKTATLFAASCQTGALSGGGSKDIADTMHSFGKYFGLMYQILDDIHDYTLETRGKIKGDDFREGKVTFPILLAYKADSDKNFWHKQFAKTERSEADFNQALERLSHFKVFEESLNRAKNFGIKAKECLARFNSGPAEMLDSLIDSFF